MSWFSHSKKGKGSHVTGPFTDGRKLPQEQTSSLIKAGKPGFLGCRVPCVLDRLTIVLIFQRRKKGAINNDIWGKLGCMVTLWKRNCSFHIPHSPIRGFLFVLNLRKGRHTQEHRAKAWQSCLIVHTWVKADIRDGDACRSRPMRADS